MLAVVVWLGEPRLGVDVVFAQDGRAVVTWVRPGTPAWDTGVRVGDVLLAIDGTDITRRTWSVRGGDRGKEFRVLSVRGGESLELSGRSPQPPNSLIASLWAIGLVFAVTGFLVFFRSRRSPQVLTLALFLLVAAIVIVLAPATARSNILAQLAEAPLVHWMSVLFLFFFYIFARRRHWLVPTMMSAIALLLNVLWMVGVLAVPEVFDMVRRLTFAYVGAAFLSGVALLAWTYLGARSPVTREQVRIMAVGTAAAVGPIIIFSVLPAAAGLPFVLRPEVTVLGLTLIPLSFGYAIMRHHLMGIRRLVHRGAAYALISFCVFVLYGALIATLGQVGGPEVSENVAAELFLLAALFVAVPSMSGTRRLAFAAVDRLLYREYIDHADLARRVSIHAAYAKHFDDLATTVLGTIVRELRLSFASFIGLSDGGARVKASVGAVPDGLVSLLDSKEEGKAEQGLSLLRLSTDLYAEHVLMVKLKRQPHETWVLCFGPKVTEEPFQREDMKLAESVAGHMATIVEKLELLEELRSKAGELRELNRWLVQAQETERARIASYIHDEPLQQITNVIWQHAGAGLSSEVQQKLQRIAEDLRNCTARLHPALLEDLGLVRALEWLGTEASAASGFKVVFSYGPVERDGYIPPEIQLALYRIAQEALTNCRRHASASTVWVHLAWEEDQVTLTIEDDGVGFQQTRDLSPGTRLGVIGMRERAEQLGGCLLITPRSPSGTTVVASLPIDGPSSLQGVNGRGNS